MPLAVPNGIRAMRQAARFHGRRITQANLAKALKTDAPRVSQMEAGYLIANERELHAIARVLRCEIGDLYGGRWLSAILEEAHGPASPQAEDRRA